MCDVGVSISDVATKRYIVGLIPAWAQEPGYKASTQLAYTGLGPGALVQGQYTAGLYRPGPRSLGTRPVHSYA